MKMKKEHPETHRFYQAYANVPVNLRSKEIFAVVDDEPMTLSVIKLEVDAKTEIGYKAVQQLVDLNII